MNQLGIFIEFLMPRLPVCSSHLQVANICMSALEHIPPGILLSIHQAKQPLEINIRSMRKTSTPIIPSFLFENKLKVYFQGLNLTYHLSKQKLALVN